MTHCAPSALNHYYNTLGEEQQVEHKAALKRSFTKIEGDQSLSQWFNKMGNKYFIETEAEKAARKVRVCVCVCVCVSVWCVCL
jgi:hypothetical protein